MRSWERGNFSCSSRPRPQACTRPPHHHSLVTSFIDHFLNTLLRCTEYLNVLVDVGGFFKTSNYLSNLPPSAPFWINWLVWLYKTNISAASEFCCMAWQATHATTNHSPIYPYTFTFTAMLRLWFLSLSPSQRIQTCRAVTRLGHDPIRVSELSY